MAGIEWSSPEFYQTTIPASVFDGKSTGSKREARGTHLGDYRGSRNGRRPRTTEAGGRRRFCMFGEGYRVNQSTRERKRERGNLVGDSGNSARALIRRRDRE